MRRYMLISHGRFAEGCWDTLNLFLGERNPYTTICAYVDDQPAQQKLDDYLSTVAAGDELVICSDLMGGSVNQLVTPLLRRNGTYLVAGVNLPLLMELAALPTDEPLTEEAIAEVVELCRKSTMVFMNQKYKTITAAEGDE